MIDFMLFRGFGNRQMNRQTDGRTDICCCRVAFATENHVQCFGFEDEGRRISYFIYHPYIKYWKVFA